MKKTGYKKPTTFEEHGKGCIVLVTSRDPGTKIKILKEGNMKKRRAAHKHSDGIGLFDW